MLTRSPWLVASTLLPLLVAGTAVSSPTAGTPVSTTTMVSTNTAGTAGANDPSSEVSVSADGRFVAFSSAASDLMPIPTRGVHQVFVRDLLTGSIRLVSESGTLGVAGDRDSYQPAISADGTFVAFTSVAGNLDPLESPTRAFNQVYVRDLRPGGTTRLVSVNARLDNGGNGSSREPVISADGSRVAFQSIASDLVAGATPINWQVYVAAAAPSTPSATRFVSLQDVGRSPDPDLANSDAFDPTISGDGAVVGFSSTASNLTADDYSGAFQQVFAHSMTTGETRLVSSEPGTRKAGDRSSSEPSISGDGVRMAFVSRSTNLTAGGVSGDGHSDQIYSRDLTGSAPSRLISLDHSGNRGGRADSRAPAISLDGKYVAFASDSRDLTAGWIAEVQVYVRDVVGQHTTLVSTNRHDPTSGGTEISRAPSISAHGEAVGFSGQSDDLTDVTNSGHVEQVFLTRLAGARVDRIGGLDRFAVSAAVSADLFGSETPVAYVASGTVFPDALSASAAAGAMGAPVLLVTRDAVPAPVATELARLKPKAIVLLGGLNAVGPGVEVTLKSIAPTTRVGGPDRYAVSAALAAKTFTTSPPVAYIASGDVFPDALSGSAVAGRLGGPVLLVQKDQIPGTIEIALTALGATRLVVLGGTNTISAGVEAKLNIIAPTTRITGADRFEVSAAVSHESIAPRTHTVYVASGAVFPDALSGGAAAAANGSPVLLVTKDAIPTSVAEELDRIRPTRIVVLGGTNTISDSVATALEQYLRAEPK